MQPAISGPTNKHLCLHPSDPAERGRSLPAGRRGGSLFPRLRVARRGPVCSHELVDLRPL